MVRILSFNKHVSLRALVQYTIHYPSNIFSSEDKWKWTSQMNDGSFQAFALVSRITGQNIEIIYCAGAVPLVPASKTLLTRKTRDVVHTSSL